MNYEKPEIEFVSFEADDDIMLEPGVSTGLGEELPPDWE